MPKRWEGLTPASADSFDPLPERQFLNPLYEVADITDETLEIPDTCCWSLDHIVHGNPLTSTNLTVSSGPGGSGTVYATQLTAPSTNYQVQVEPATGFLKFYTGDIGNTVYCTYRAHVSNFDMASIAQMYAAIRRSDWLLGGFMYVAGENVVAGLGYADVDTVYTADPADLTKCGWLWITEAKTAGQLVLCLTLGTVTSPRAEIPKNTPLYCGQGGKITWWADTDSSYKLTPGQYAHCIGYCIDGSMIHLNLIQDVSRFSE